MPSIPISAPAAGPIWTWPAPSISDAFELADIVLASTEDLLPLYPGASNEDLLARIPGGEVVLKLSEPASILRLDGVLHRTKAEPLTKPVVDTTAAGDSFAAAYIAARLAGAEPVEAARAGHRSGRRCGMSSRRDHPAHGDAGLISLADRQPLARRPHERERDSKAGKARGLVKSATVIPVLTIERLEHAVPLARALVAGGVRMLEVTLRTPVAIEAAKAMIAEVPDAIVGIGTILNGDDLKRAEALGAKFGISPGATPELLKAAAASDLPFAPGIATASELMQALAHGFDLVKFFPAEQSGGIKALRALAGPFPNIRVCPTGGIGEANAAAWLAEPNVLAVGGSWLCPAADIRSGNWAGISAMCARAMKTLKPA